MEHRPRSHAPVPAQARGAQQRRAGMLLAICLAACTLPLHAGASGYEASGEAPHPARLLWGDTHVHTAWSSDSYLFGNRRLGPEEAFRFARGETVTASNGQRARLQRALDFLVIADHAENLGMMHYIASGDPAAMATPNAERWRARLAHRWGSRRWPRVPWCS